MLIKNLLFVLFVSIHCFYILMISKLLDVMILNKSLLLYVNHFDSINKDICNRDRAQSLLLTLGASVRPGVNFLAHCRNFRRTVKNFRRIASNT